MRIHKKSLFVIILFVISEIAVVVIVWVDDDLFDNNLWVNHDELQGVTTRCCSERGVEPAEIVEHLVTTGELTTVHKTAQSETATWRQRLQHLWQITGSCDHFTR